MNFQNTGSLSLISIHLLYDLRLVYSIAKEVNVWIFPYLRLPQESTISRKLLGSMCTIII